MSLINFFKSLFGFSRVKEEAKPINFEPEIFVDSANNNLANQHILEINLCKEKNIPYEKYKEFFEKSFPEIDRDVSFLREHNSDILRAEYKIHLYNYSLAIDFIAENHLNIQFVE